MGPTDGQDFKPDLEAESVAEQWFPFTVSSIPHHESLGWSYVGTGNSIQYNLSYVRLTEAV